MSIRHHLTCRMASWRRSKPLYSVRMLRYVRALFLVFFFRTFSSWAAQPKHYNLRGRYFSPAISLLQFIRSAPPIALRGEANRDDGREEHPRHVYHLGELGAAGRGDVDERAALREEEQQQSVILVAVTTTRRPMYASHTHDGEGQCVAVELLVEEVLQGDEAHGDLQAKEAGRMSFHVDKGVNDKDHPEPEHE